MFIIKGRTFCRIEERKLIVEDFIDNTTSDPFRYGDTWEDHAKRMKTYYDRRGADGDFRIPKNPFLHRSTQREDKIVIGEKCLYVNGRLLAQECGFFSSAISWDTAQHSSAKNDSEIYVVIPKNVNYEEFVEFAKFFFMMKHGWGDKYVVSKEHWGILIRLADLFLCQW